jgi:pilus assembly protein CpaE
MAEKILIVDDDVDSLKLIGLMLQRHGYEVSAANTGAQALSKAESEIPSLVILDVMMPDMNGLEVCRRLRANAKTNEIPIIMFTAKTLIDDKVKGFEAGADDYLTKPTHPAELASRVKAILARSAAKKEAAAQQVSNKPRNSTIGVIGAKGGVGTTSVAINVAAGLMVAGENPIVADFRLGSGSLASMLGLIRTQSMGRLLSGPLADINVKSVENSLASHASGLRALVSSINPKEAQLKFNDDQALAVVNNLRTIGKPTVFDLGSGYTSLNARLLLEMERILIVVEPNSMALNMARELIKQIDEDGGGSRISVVVVSRSQSSLQTSWQDVENLLGREIKGIISAAPELAYQAIESKNPIILLQPNSVVAGQFAKLADSLKAKIKSIAGGQLTT